MRLSLKNQIRRDYADFLYWVGHKLLKLADWMERR